MKKNIIILITIILLITVDIPCFGDDLEIHGEINFTYEIAPFNPGQTWTINLWYNINNWLTLGTNQTTFTNGFNNNSFSFVPVNQLYENYLQINVNKNVYIKVCQWCNHPVYNGINDFNKTIFYGTFIEGNYKF